MRRFVFAPLSSPARSVMMAALTGGLVVFAQPAPASERLTSGRAAPAAERAIAGPVQASVVRVVDGDTLRVVAQVWVDQEITVSVRLDGVNAAELFRPRCEAERVAARASQAALTELVGESVQLMNVRHDKYAGRVVAQVLTPSGADLAATMVARGHAEPAVDARPWCTP